MTSTKYVDAQNENVKNKKACSTVDSILGQFSLKIDTDDGLSIEAAIAALGDIRNEGLSTFGLEKKAFSGRPGGWVFF